MYLLQKQSRPGVNCRFDTILAVKVLPRLPREQVYRRGNAQHMITKQRRYSGETRGVRCVTSIHHAGAV